MDKKYTLGIPEIDAQHEEINKFVASLQEVIAAKHRHYLIHPTLKRLNHLLIHHFACEESLMEMVSYPELPQHRIVHKGVLKVFEDYFCNPPLADEFDNFGKSVSDKVLGHLMAHDARLAHSIRKYLAENPLMSA